MIYKKRIVYVGQTQKTGIRDNVDLSYKRRRVIVRIERKWTKLDPIVQHKLHKFDTGHGMTTNGSFSVIIGTCVLG